MSAKLLSDKIDDHKKVQDKESVGCVVEVNLHGILHI